MPSVTTPFCARRSVTRCITCPRSASSASVDSKFLRNPRWVIAKRMRISSLTPTSPRPAGAPLNRLAPLDASPAPHRPTSRPTGSRLSSVHRAATARCGTSPPACRRTRPGWWGRRSCRRSAAPARAPASALRCMSRAAGIERDAPGRPAHRHLGRVAHRRSPRRACRRAARTADSSSCVSRRSRAARGVERQAHRDERLRQAVASRARGASNGLWCSTSLQPSASPAPRSRPTTRNSQCGCSTW